MTGGSLKDSFLAEGFLLDKKIGVGQVSERGHVWGAQTHKGRGVGLDSCMMEGR